MCCNTTTIVGGNVRVFADDMLGLSERLTISGATMERTKAPVIRIRRNGWTCLIGLNLVCQSAKTFAGLGDNISSAGFVYHDMKNSSVSA